MEQETAAAGANECTGLEVAVTGMAGRFPGAGDIARYWRNVKNGVESIAFFSRQELEEDGVEALLLDDPAFVKAYGWLERIEYFDADFFDYSPREADIMDPQMRVFHQCAWHALEDAGYSPADYEGNIGLYAGASCNFQWQARVQLSGKAGRLGQYASYQLADKDFLTLRPAYKFNLKGPAVLVQTACSTSLAAIHIACQAILNGECDMALAGGVSIGVLKKTGYLYREGLIGSPDGHCRPFDAAAGGTIGGSGVGLVVLKRLENALTDGDHIYAVVKGSAINNDGFRKVGFTAPGIDGQAEAIKTALAVAETDAESIAYVETHGTGTGLGDPVEIAALTRAFGTGKKGYCAVGSVKSNIGHLDAAAGVAGFIKAVLALYHRRIPPTLHFTTPNARIDFAHSPFYVNTKLSPWKSEPGPLRAGVSSFGMGGANAHVILEEAPGSAGRRDGSPPATVLSRYRLILLSARTEPALERMTENLRGYFRKNSGNPGNPISPGLNPGQMFADAAYTLRVGRGRFPYRSMLVCRSAHGAVEILSSPDSDKIHTHVLENKEQTPAVVFMFPGQGAQYVNMGLDLYKSQPVFREEMDRCFEILEPIMNIDLKEVLYPPPESHASMQSCNHGAPSGIGRTEIAQPLIFTVEYALAKLLMKWGVRPYAMTGHSIGEYTAACLAGVFSLEDALKLVVLRGRFMQRMPPGAMLSVGLGEDLLVPLLEPHETLSLAAVNGSSLCTVSGPGEAIGAFARELEEKGYTFRRLHTSHAYHSAMMDPVLAEFEAAVGQVQRNPAQIPYISNLTGTWIAGEEAPDPAYWSAHLRKTVRFAYGLEKLLARQDSIFVEAGPGNVLGTFVRKHRDRTPAHHVINLIRHPKENIADDCFLLTQTGRLWLYDVPMDRQAFHAGGNPRRIPLPVYPFQEKRFPIGTGSVGGKEQAAPRGLQTGKKKDTADWFYIPGWTRSTLTPVSLQQKRIPPQTPRLVFMDDCGLGERLVNALEQEEPGLTVVRKAGKFEKVSMNEYTLDPGQSGHYEALFRGLRADDRVPSRLVHLWSITGAGDSGPGALTVDSVDEAQESAFYSLLLLARAMGGLDAAFTFHIDVVSAGMQEVTGGEVCCPQAALVLGPVNVIPKEYPNIRCRSIDILFPVPGDAAVDRLVQELLWGADSPGSVIALRGHYRWVQECKPIRLEGTGKQSLPRCLRQKGVYLVTGGLGGMGLVLAEYLVQAVQARVILTGRSTFPPRDQWQDWLETHDQQDPVSVRIGRIRELEARGGEVSVFSADAADEEQMRTVVWRVRERYGRIHGVIHAAGAADGGMIQRRTRETCRPVLAPKVKGTLVLDKLLQDPGPDFFVLCSSLSSIAAPFGQVAYGSANAFLDAFALYKSQNSPCIYTSIDWDTWQETGMAVETAGKLGISAEEHLTDGILSCQGADVFRRILSHPFPRVAVCTRDLETKIEMQENEPDRIAGFMESLRNQGTAAALHQRPNLGTTYREPGDGLEQTLAEIFQDFLGIEKVGINDNFFELGISSLDLVQIAAELKKQLNKDVPVVTFFTYAAVRSLARFLDRDQKEETPKTQDEPEDLLESTMDLLEPDEV